MSDDTSENHDGNTQPLPANMAAGASTEPLAADALSTEPVAQAPSAVVAGPAMPRWVPSLIVGLVILAVFLLAIMILPGLLAPFATSTPAPTVTSPAPTATPTEDTEEPPPPSEEPSPEPEPTVSVPVPTVDPPEPTPEPTG
jgi:hypothetical protein